MELNMPYHRNPAVKKAWWDPQDGYFKWEIDRGAKKKVLRQEFVNKLVQLSRTPSIEAILRFTEEYGPLWSGNGVRSTLALSRLWVVAHLWVVVLGLREIGQPKKPFADYADAFLFSPLEEWLSTWDPDVPIPVLPPGFHEKPQETVAQAILRSQADMAIKALARVAGSKPPRRRFALWCPPDWTGSGTCFVAVEDSNEYWPRFRLPKEPLDTWEKKKEWFIRELGRNVCELLREGMEFYPVIVKDPDGGMGHAVIRARCKDAFTFAMAHLVFEWRYRVCPVCGKPAIGSTCGSSRCKKASLTTAAKQQVLDYLYHQQRRGKITGEQYDLCKQIADRWKHLDDAGRLMAKVAASMQKKWPERDFSFILKGFGSRKASQENPHPREE